MANSGEIRSLKGALRRLRAAQRAAEQLARDKKHLPGDAEWLLDNAYIAQREGRAALEVLKHAPAPGAFPAARAFLKQMGFQVETMTVQRFLDIWQREQILSEQELCAFPAALRAALVEKLAELSADVLHRLDSGAQEGEGSGLVGTAFMALRALSELDFGLTLEAVNRTEAVLREDPAGIYAKMDEASRAEYRRRLAKLAKKRRQTEYAAARDLVERAKAEDRHVGFFLFPEKNEARNGGAYIATIVLATAFLTLLAGFLAENAAVALLLLFPLSETVKNLLDCLLLRLVKPRYVPRMEAEQAVPETARTLCVVSALLSSEASGARIAALLEQYRLANRSCGKNLVFGILSDLPESRQAETPEDEEKLQAAREAIEKLNEKYGGGFLLLCRPRTLATADGVYMGWERKRGAILELMRLLRGRPSGLYLAAGAEEGLENIQYVITLDADTRLNVGAAGELIAAMRHPLNRPVVKKGRVQAGHGLLAPRIGTELAAAAASDFARIFAGQGGVDPYGSRASDLYFDLYGDGSFTGKGILDVDAYLECLEGRFPENTVLSHDLLEGAFLRCGYVGDVELSDGFPSGVLSYFERLHRWVRGDWQAARWLFSRVPTERGKKKNSLPQLDRWKLLDNLRRSLVPVFTFAALMTGMLTNGMDFLLAGAAALLSAASGLLISLADGAMRPGGLRRKRFHATVIYGLAGVIMQLLLRLALLPYKATLCLNACLTALYRMLISKKHMLQWVTAADSERKSRGGLSAYYRRMWACVTAGLFALGFSLYPFGAALGLYWVLGPALACSLSRTKAGGAKLSRQSRLYLLRCAGDIWRYFTDFLIPEDHYLPPDNVQEEPDAGPAHRTSPTNIGLAMLSVLAASDLGLCDLGTMRQLLGCMMTTVEQLPKWNGHLYNWYDTRTLKSLQPPYVSTVDSGNLAGCLVVLQEGLSGLDNGLAKRAGALLEAMDFSLLYDRKRRLFRIGLDPQRPEAGESYYDLLASEARLTSYFAVARGQVPRKHWRRLGRGQVSLGGYAGMASWTGTMFEYLMPNLVMPCYENSLIWESVRFCIYAQRRGAGKQLPWGVSESAYYALDAARNYRYKAHGMAALALKRGMGEERVVSPYSTFLALPWCTGSAIRNLKRLAALGAEGRWGFMEALDFTPGRAVGTEPGLVRTYMAHHLGMSIVSIANTLLDGVMPRRFMADSSMAAYAELLQEKVPVGEHVFKQPPQETPEPPRRPVSPGWRFAADGTDWKNPRGTLLASGGYTVLAFETGASCSMQSGRMVTRFEEKRLGGSVGMSFYFQSGEALYALQPAPFFQKEGAYSAELSGGTARIRANFDALESVVTTTVSSREAGEKRVIHLKNKGRTAMEGTVALYFEPVLARPADYFAHPAFSKLALETRLEEEGVLIRRRGEAVGAFLAADAKFQVDSSKELALGRGGELSMAKALKAPAGNSQGAVLDPCILARVPLHLAPGGEAEFSFALAVGEAPKAAALRILKERPSRENRLDAMAQNLGMGLPEVEAAMAQLPNLVFPPLDPDPAAGGGRSLWPFGISGDYPILAEKVESEEQAMVLIRRHALLSYCGLRLDLVLIVDDGGDYRRPLTTAIRTGVKEAGLEGVAGLHIVDCAAGDTAPLLAMSRDRDYSRSVERPAEAPKYNAHGGEEHLEWHFEPDGSFAFSGQNVLPQNAWSQMLTNGRFGALMTDAGTGHVWNGNARENRLSPWLNDSLATWGPERLYVNGVCAFAALDGLAYSVRYGFGFAQWEKEDFRVTAFTPPDVDARVLLIESSDRRPLHVRYSLELEDPLGSIDEKEGIFLIKRPSNYEFKTTIFKLCATGKGNPFSGIQGGKEIAITVGTDVKEKLVALTEITEARRVLEETKTFWRARVCKERFKSPWPALNDYMNGWALYQTMACRVMGRTSVYQSGGAFGFRDQLQDVCALLETAPELARAQILLACAHQYAEGDVQHWWHPTPAGDRGVRTRCSDDLIWLPYVAAEYVEKTGDRALLDVCIPYLLSAPLEAGVRDRYEMPEKTAEGDCVLNHCIRALDLSLDRGLGAHGLPLIGDGDWNDGYSKIGAAGRGESVWLAWFLAMTLKKFAPYCEKKRATAYWNAAEGLIRAATACWDGDRFLRAYFDDGTPLGSRRNEEGAMDSLAQSFSALAGCPDKKKVETALRTAVRVLFDRERQVVKLLDPPFSGAAPDPGYISRYPAGVRENGGQYTHAAIWLAMACFEAGLRQEGTDILLALLPQAHAQEQYRVEPYVLAADVYANPQHRGRGGWSWYTGAAGWYYQAVRRYLPEFFGE